MIRPPSRETWVLALGLAILVGGLGSRKYLREDDGVRDVSIDSPAFDFGKVRQGQTLVHTFYLKNGGDVPIVITEVGSTCSCTTANNMKLRVIGSGSTSEVPVSLKTGVGNGPEMGRITLFYRSAAKTDAPVHYKEVQVVTDVVPDYQVRPTLIDFGTVDHYGPVSRLVHLRPEAMEDVAVLGLTTTSEALTARRLHSPAGETEVTIELTFSGRALWKSGMVEAMASIETSSTGNPISQILTRARFVAPVEIDPTSIIVGADSSGSVYREVRIDAAKPVRIVALRCLDPAVRLDEVSPREGRSLRVNVTIAGDDPRHAINSEIAIDLALKSGTDSNEARTVTIPIHRLATE